ncbi:putative E3 ubiquitin-protein ligase RING1a isoform X1 [Arachis hypogaea]|uniref:putative E3 ubiquitin-protein ligase RING1a isoform X1 n=1 Tax=Arachis hypogaea TaxID=3818 RepID=UPI000DEC1D13|nr:putative E3 ubiquitin-protein ligase RING1a isoform X1 [Arachis hypogaea]QHO02789.1 Putative E3 ubiquitin-protein ligase RING1a [Arachis hypogaea]
MPAQKRLHGSLEEHEDALRANSVEKQEDEVESDRSNSLSNGDKEEYVVIKLADVRKEVQCPICLGIIRKTRTVMECLHRFCRECIDKSMRLGNNECPACRTHCASRRSLRDDPNYDALIAALYPDIDKYEEEELALHEDEVTHNKQKIQASIAQTLRRQTEALGKKRNAKSAAVAFVRRSQGNYRTSNMRRRKRFRNAGEQEVSDDNEGVNDNEGGKGSSSCDEQTENRPKRCKRGGETQFPQHSASTEADVAGEENTPEGDRDVITSSGSTLAWGKNGQRSHTRGNGKNSANGKNSKNSRISKLVDRLHSSEENDDRSDIFLVVVSMDKQRGPNLQEPYLQCKPTLSVSSLSKYVAVKTAQQPDDVELCLVEEPGEPQVNIIRGERTVDPKKDKVRALGEQETLAELKSCNLIRGYLLMAYKRKL